MQKGISIGFVVFLLALLAPQAWAQSVGGFGGGFSGHPGMSHFGGFQGSLRHPGFQEFSHFDHFQHEEFFGRPFFPVRPQVVVIRSPFFCFPDGLAFTDQALFFDHLHQVHGIPVDRASLFCQQVLGGRLIFFGF